MLLIFLFGNHDILKNKFSPRMSAQSENTEYLVTITWGEYHLLFCQLPELYNWETQVQSLGREDPLEKEMATHSNILARETPRSEEPGKLQSTRLQ